MTMLDISSYYQVFARAVMMLCAIAIDTATTMRNNASVTGNGARASCRPIGLVPGTACRAENNKV